MYTNKKTTGGHNSEGIVYDCGYETKDSYSIETTFYLEIENNRTNYRSRVVKNGTYNLPPATGKVEGKKYREVLHEGEYRDCLNYIRTIIIEQGYWTQDPNTLFNKIFIKDVVKDVINLIKKDTYYYLSHLNDEELQVFVDYFNNNKSVEQNTATIEWFKLASKLEVLFILKRINTLQC